MTPCIYLKKMPQKCLNHYPTNNSIWDTWYVSTRYLDIYLVYIVHTRRFHTKKMLTKMGLRATIQLLDAICQPHVRKALVKGTTRKYFCLFVWRHLKIIFLLLDFDFAVSKKRKLGLKNRNHKKCKNINVLTYYKTPTPPREL